MQFHTASPSIVSFPPSLSQCLISPFFFASIFPVCQQELPGEKYQGALCSRYPASGKKTANWLSCPVIRSGMLDMSRRETSLSLVCDRSFRCSICCFPKQRTSHSFNESQPMYRKRNFLKISLSLNVTKNHIMSLVQFYFHQKYTRSNNTKTTKTGWGDAKEGKNLVLVASPYKEVKGKSRQYRTRQDGTRQVQKPDIKKKINTK